MDVTIFHTSSERHRNMTGQNITELRPSGWATGIANPEWQLPADDPWAEVETAYANGDELSPIILNEYFNYLQSLAN